jgi:hypothetical protein
MGGLIDGKSAAPKRTFPMSGKGQLGEFSLSLERTAGKRTFPESAMASIEKIGL